MKKNIYFLILFIFLILLIFNLLLFSCARPWVQTKEPLAKILVYVGNVTLGESGRSADGTELNIGGKAIFSAQGRDAKGNPISINPTWTPTKPNIIKIEPMKGSVVTITGLNPGTVDIVVEYAGVKKTVELITVKE